MSEQLTVPELGESITEAQIVKWHKAEGDRVEVDEIVAELETDKASVELPSTVSGEIESILKHEGDTVAVGEAIAKVSGNGQAATKRKTSSKVEARQEEEQQSDDDQNRKPEDKRAEEYDKSAEEEDAQPSEDKNSSQESDAETADDEAEEREEVAKAKRRKDREKSGRDSEEKPKEKKEKRKERAGNGAEPVESSPRLMPAAEEELKAHGMSADDVEGSGPAGRILPRDVERAARQKGTSEENGEKVITLSEFQQQEVAARIHAWQNIPQAVATEQIDLRGLLNLLSVANRDVLGHRDENVHITGFFASAICNLISRFPEINAELRGIEMIFKSQCHLNVWMNSANGRVGPLIQNVEKRSPAEISKSLYEFRKLAGAKELEPKALENGTLSIHAMEAEGVLIRMPTVSLGQSAAFVINARHPYATVHTSATDTSEFCFVSMAYDQRLITEEIAEYVLRALKTAIENPVDAMLMS